MYRGASSSILIGVIELDPHWSNQLELAGDESPWEHLQSLDRDCLDMSEAAEILADNERLQAELDEQYALLLRARR